MALCNQKTGSLSMWQWSKTQLLPLFLHNSLGARCEKASSFGALCDLASSRAGAAGKMKKPKDQEQ